LWGANVCDALSAVHIRAALAGGTAMGLLAAFDHWRKPALGERMLVTGLAGLLAALPLYFDRQCFLDPFSALDPLVRELWLDTVQEAYSIPKIVAEYPEGFWGLVMPMALGAGAIAFAASLERGLARVRYAALLALALAGCATAFYMARSINNASQLALLGGVWAGVRVLQWRGGGTLRTALLALLTLAPFTAVFWIGLAPPEKKAEKKEQARTLEDCISRASYAPIRALPPGVVLALPDLGPFMLIHTEHSVMAAPYHRNNHGNRLMLDAFLAPPDKARDLLRAAGVRYIAICDATDQAAPIEARAPQGLLAAITKEAPLEWLRPIRLETPVSIYEVVAAP
jgi:hypothetical protein